MGCKMEKRRELFRVIKGLNPSVEKVSKIWNELPEEEKKKCLDLDDSDSCIKLALIHCRFETIKYLLEESKKFEMFQEMLLGDEENKFPLLNYLLTSEELWKRGNLSIFVSSYSAVFEYLYKSLQQDQQEAFKELAFNKSGLIDKLIETGNEKSLQMFKTVVNPSADHKNVIYIGLEKIAASQLKDVKLDYTREEIEKSINAVVFTEKDKKGDVSLVPTARPELVTAMSNLQSYAAELKSKTDLIAKDKSNAIILLINEMSAVEGADPYEKISNMKTLVYDKLKPRDPEETILLKNRGLNAYKAASSFATFFGRPDYKFEYDGNTYYANSSTEHRLIQLYNALSKWEESARPQEESKPTK